MPQLSVCLRSLLHRLPKHECQRIWALHKVTILFGICCNLRITIDLGEIKLRFSCALPFTEAVFCPLGGLSGVKYHVVLVHFNEAHCLCAGLRFCISRTPVHQWSFAVLPKLMFEQNIAGARQADEQPENQQLR
ncbi:hypothetical protein ACVWZL_000783 [Bradyrhizobium sp. GM2.4]